jgi:hypothetical protein
MLVPAWLERPRLAEAIATFERSARWRSLYCRSNRSEFKIEDNDWSYIQRASVAADGSLLGYVSADIDRDNREAQNILAIAFEPGAFEWAIDLRAFVRGLVAEFEVVHWCTIAGTPNAEMYRRAVERAGGRVVGTFARRGRTPGGRLVDVEWYELLGQGGRGA